jgi:hypothetical protein
MLTFLSYLVVFWLGIGFGFFFRRLAAMAACIAFCVLAFAPTSAAALTKHECIHAGYGCQWSKASGGRAHGWYFARERHRETTPRQTREMKRKLARIELQWLIPERPPLAALSFYPVPIPAGSPQARINDAFTAVGMGRR